MDLIVHPNEILKTPSIDINVSDLNEVEELSKLISEMKTCLNYIGGLGLSACQVGVNKNVFICKIKEGITPIINPKIIARSGVFWSRAEGCLSVPGVRKDIKRSKMVKIRYIDENYKEITMKLFKFPAAIIQHEMDHLKGKLIIDY